MSWRDIDPDSSRQSHVGQTLGELLPVSAPVRALEDSVPRAGYWITPGSADPVPHGNVERLGVLRIHDQVPGAYPLRDVEDFFPGRPSIRRLEHTSFFIIGPFMARGCDIDNIRILRVDDDSADCIGVGKTHVLPGLSRVG